MHELQAIYPSPSQQRRVKHIQKSSTMQALNFIYEPQWSVVIFEVFAGPPMPQCPNLPCERPNEQTYSHSTRSGFTSTNPRADFISPKPAATASPSGTSSLSPVPLSSPTGTSGAGLSQPPPENLQHLHSSRPNAPGGPTLLHPSDILVTPGANSSKLPTVLFMHWSGRATTMSSVCIQPTRRSTPWQGVSAEK